MTFKIYTKTGDKGMTSLIGGSKVPKSHLRIESYGTVDELNSHVGLCRDLLEDSTSRDMLLEVQDRLFTIGSSLACDPQKETGMSLPSLEESDIQTLETEIDRMTEATPPMRSFILPGGHPSVSQLHIARCVCRRAERCCVRLEDETAGDHALVIKYLNRLSDYLFTLARYTSCLLKVEEIPWRPRRKGEGGPVKA
jgi:cob(I)alamin adenosyltransferase